MQIMAWELEFGDQEELPYLGGLYWTREIL